MNFGNPLKRFVQQGRRGFGARSVQGVREDDKTPRTQLADFFKGLPSDQGNTTYDYRI
jgi:hypothetical protein